MTESLTSRTCPGCGAPLQLLPDGSCRWCHAMVAPTGSGWHARAEAFYRLADSWGNHWTLGAAPGSKHEVPWAMAPELLSPAKEILGVLQAGVGQPGLSAIAATHDKSPDLDWQCCLLLNTVISAGIEANNSDAPAAYLQACDLLDALAGMKDTDPQWAQRARETAARARADFGTAWQAATDGDDPDPFQTELRAWIADQLKKQGHHHFWQR